jgi:hypothetical protein
VRTRLLALLAAATALAVPSAVPTGAATSGQAIVGVFPSYNVSTLDTTNGGFVGPFLQPDIGVPTTGTGSYLNAMNAWQGKRNSVITFYDGIDSNMFKTWAPAIWDTYHAVPFVSMTTDPPADVLSGKSDGSLTQLNAEMKTWLSGAADTFGQSQSTHRRLYIRLDWEANGSWYAYSPTYGGVLGDSAPTTCADLAAKEAAYRDMWRYVHDKVMAGVDETDVAWVFSVNSEDVVPAGLQGCGAASDLTASLYPGDAYVDWVGIDGYGFCTTDAGVPTQSPSQVLAPMVARLTALTSKPISVNEVGTSTASRIQTSNYLTKNTCSDGATKGRWVRDYLDYLEAAGIRMTLWFNADIYQGSEPIDWAVFALAGPQDLVGNGTSAYTDTALSYNAYAEYPAGLASPWFLDAGTSNPRVLTDAQFLGTW